MKKLKRIPTLQFVHKSIACLLAFCVINMPVWAIQNGDVINSGGANITITDNVLTNVNVGAGNTSIDWGNLDTVTGEQLNFNGSGNFAVLNNVIGTSATNFNGILNGGGGHIIIVNQHGVVFGQTAQISAAHFTASTLAISDFDAFVNGEGSWFHAGDAMGAIELQAGSSINAKNIELIAQEIKNSGHLVSDGGLIILATGDDIYLGSKATDIVVQVNAPIQGSLSYSVSNEADGVIETNGGDLVLAAGDDFAQAIVRDDAYRIPGQYTVLQSGTVESANLDMSAANAVLTTAGSDTQASDINIGALAVEIGTEGLTAGNDLVIDSKHGVVAFADIASGDTMSITSYSDTGSVTLAGSVTSGGTMDIASGNTIVIADDAVSGDSMTLTAVERTITTGNLKAENDILLDTDLAMLSDGDQSITSVNGGIAAKGTVQKLSETGGELYVSAQDDIQLDDTVTNYQGGVSVISKGGMIHTGNSTELNVAINGYSDEEAGVDLPYGDGKAAIVLMSNDTLTLGEKAVLTASGGYQPTILDPETGDVLFEGADDRDGVNFLSTDDKVIGGFARDAGDPIDVAIYVASTAGDVVFNNLDNFNVNNEMENNDSTVVLDAFNSVRFQLVEDLIAAGDYDEFVEFYQMLIDMGYSNEAYGSFRLEVASRVTQWLDEAIANGTLPFADATDIMEFILGNDYVLRGAGVPSNGYNEAWVLENEQTSVVALAAPLQQLELPELKGCPAEMDAAASELAVNTDQMQMMIASSMASNPNIQPCEACSSLLTAAAALKDVDGMRMAALAEVFNTLAPADAPFTPEVQASISTAFAELSADNPQYAMAMEYADAFANYVAILDNDLKLPVGDPVALVMEKYGEAIANADNPNIASYINGQIEANAGSL